MERILLIRILAVQRTKQSVHKSLLLFPRNLIDESGWTDRFRSPDFAKDRRLPSLSKAPSHKTNRHCKEAMPAKPLSGLQKEVLSLYRTVIREAARKDYLNLGGKRLVEFWNDPTTSSSYAQSEFRRQCKTVQRNDFRTIEYKVRNGYKQVKLLQMPGVKVVGGSGASTD